MLIILGDLYSLFFHYGFLCHGYNKMKKKPVTEEENSRQATLEVLKILDKYNLSQRRVRIIFDIIMDDFQYTTHGVLKNEKII